MPWSIKLKAGAAKSINKLDKPIRDRIRNFLSTLAIQDNPRASGKALQGELAGYWRYRVGDYRLICQIKDKELIVLVIELGHRKSIYQ
jgi:mRNA interferase RelE/StbE